MTNIFEEFKVNTVEQKSAQYKQKLLNHVSRMQDIRYLKQMLEYRPIERKPERPLKRQLCGYNRVAETGHFLA
jgi:predicted RecB family nuclease